MNVGDRTNSRGRRVPTSPIETHRQHEAASPKEWAHGVTYLCLMSLLIKCLHQLTRVTCDKGGGDAVGPT